MIAGWKTSTLQNGGGKLLRFAVVLSASVHLHGRGP